jgi:membrane-bound metal-dependent hydrolase YbcI (DUF457 family)
MIQAALHLTTAALVILLLGDTSPLIVALALLLSLAPDIDTPKSLLGALLKPVSVPLERQLGHRTATHSLAALALVTLVAYLLAPHGGITLAAAYASHLALDLLIGVQGIILFWPSGAFLTLAGWRDDGPAPRRLLLILLPITLLAASWPQFAPLLAPTLNAAVAVTNPIATPKPTPATPTPVPAITLHIALPAGVGLSALRVHVGDVLTEGQLLARWEAATPSPWPALILSPPLPTPSSSPCPPVSLSPCLLVSPPDSAASRALAEATAALSSLTTAHAAERAALLATQQRQIADFQRQLADAQRTLDMLQPAHERTQAEQQHAVAQAHQAFIDAQAAASLADAADAPATQRAAERVHSADAALRSALDAQDRMRAEQGIEREQADAAVAQAQADLAALPAQQRQALAALDGQHRAARIMAAARIDSARSQAADAQRAQAHDQAQAFASATAAAQAWQTQTTATAQAHAEAATATAAAIPTPAPTQIVSRAAGRIAAISAEEHDGQLVVTVELTP